MAAHLRRLARQLPGIGFQLHAWDYDALERHLAADELDLLVTNPEHFVLEQERGLTAIATVMPVTDGRPRTFFGGVIFTRADSPVRTLADVAAAPTAAVSDRAIAGFLLQRWELVKAGLDVNPDLHFMGAVQDQVVDEVLDGHVLVGFVRSGVLEARAREGTLDLAQLRVVGRREDQDLAALHSTELVPEWPVLVTPRVPPMLARELARALLSVAADSEAARIGEYFGFAPPADYSSVEALLRRLRMRSHGQEFELRDVLERYPVAVAVTLASLLLLALAVVLRLARDGRRLDRAAQELARARDAAQQASIAKSRFLATMSHEIRTPLNGVLGMAQLLAVPALGDEDRLEYARTILESGTSLLAILNDILDLAKVEAGRLELNPAPVAPAAVLGEIQKLFGHLAQLKGLTLTTRLEGDGQTWVHADGVRLRQMIAKLVGNAVKFTPAGSVEVVLSLPPSGPLRCEVRDSGPGIAAEQLPRLFEPFSQLEPAPSGGTGLGLSIVRDLAAAMGGAAGARSEPGRGSTFWFTASLERCAGAWPTPVPASSERAPPAALRVLVAEDSAVSRRVAEGMLRRLGCTSWSVVNGQEALEALATRGPFAAVLMDCQMPVMDGLEATRRLRALEAREGGPRQFVVAVTAAAFAEDRVRCREAGMDAFLSKPLALEELSRVLASAPRPALPEAA